MFGRFGRVARLRRVRGVIAAGAVAVAVVLAVGGTAVAIGELDQSNPGRAVSLFIGLRSAIQYAQTFTAGKTGGLDAVAFPGETDLPSDPRTSVVEIQGVTDGKPNGTVLASRPCRRRSSRPWRRITVTFDAPPRVMAGQQYAIVPRPARSCVGRLSSDHVETVPAGRSVGRPQGDLDLPRQR